MSNKQWWVSDWWIFKSHLSVANWHFSLSHLKPDQLKHRLHSPSALNCKCKCVCVCLCVSWGKTFSNWQRRPTAPDQCLMRQLSLRVLILSLFAAGLISRFAEAANRTGEGFWWHFWNNHYCSGWGDGKRTCRLTTACLKSPQLIYTHLKEAVKCVFVELWWINNFWGEFFDVWIDRWFFWIIDVCLSVVRLSAFDIFFLVLIFFKLKMLF